MMIRSFENRLLGGVCGGLEASLPLNAWLFRIVFIALTLLNPVVGVALYVAFWWLMPQQTYIHGQRSSFFAALMMLIVIFVIVGGWLYSQTGGLVTENGETLYLPLVLLVLSLIFMIRQLRT